MTPWEELQELKVKMDEWSKTVNREVIEYKEKMTSEFRWLIDVVDIIGKKVGVTSERIKEIKQSPIHFSSIYFNPLEPFRLKPEDLMQSLVGKEVMKEACKHSSQKHLEKCLKERNEKIKSMDEKLEYLIGSLTGKNERIEQLEHKLNSRTIETEAWQREYNAMTDRCSKLQTELSEVASIRNQIREELKELKERYNQLYKDHIWLINASPRNKRLVEKGCGCNNYNCQGDCGI